MIVAVAAAVTPLALAWAGHPAGGARVTADTLVAASTGTWHAAQRVPGVATLNKGGNAAVNSMSCASVGNCSAGGWYLDGSGHDQVFVVSEVNGSWHSAMQVPGTVVLNQGKDAYATSVSCASAGNCSAGGGYTDGNGHLQAFVVNES